MIAKALANYLPPVLGLALMIFLVWSTLEVHHHAKRVERLAEQFYSRARPCP